MAQHRHLVRHGEGLVLVVGDQDARGAGAPEHVVHLGAHAGPEAGVEGGERLVEQHDLGVRGQRPGQRHTLLLAAGELVRITPAQACQTDHVEELLHPHPPLRSAAQAEGDVATDRKVREQRTLLGHVADTTVLARHEHVATVVDDLRPQRDLAAVEALETGDRSAAASSSRCPRHRGWR